MRINSTKTCTIILFLALVGISSSFQWIHAKETPAVADANCSPWVHFNPPSVYPYKTSCERLKDGCQHRCKECGFGHHMCKPTCPLCMKHDCACCGPVRALRKSPPCPSTKSANIT